MDKGRRDLYHSLIGFQLSVPSWSIPGMGRGADRSLSRDFPLPIQSGMLFYRIGHSYRYYPFHNHLNIKEYEKNYSDGYNQYIRSATGSSCKRNTREQKRHAGKRQQ